MVVLLNLVNRLLSFANLRVTKLAQEPAKVKEIVRQLLPNGSRGKPGDVDDYPRWPPDVFAVAAFLLQQSDSYAFVQHRKKGELGHELEEESEFLQITGELWSELPCLESEFHQKVDDLWRELAFSEDLISSARANSSWVIAAAKLVIIADVACAGIGFHTYKDEDEIDWIPAIYSLLNIGYLTGEEAERDIFSAWESSPWIFEYAARKVKEVDDPYRSGGALTACLFVPSTLLCVHPKARTPTVGCTLRSLTHHLSLHPSVGQLKSLWKMPEVTYGNERDEFNVLVVPYPYSIPDSAFVGTRPKGRLFGLFHIEPLWLDAECLPGQSLTELVARLFRSAKSRVGQVDAIVFPEAALDEEAFDSVARTLAEIDGGEQLILISGITPRSQRGSFENKVKCQLIVDNERAVYEQRKHHRWKLDARQIENYSLEARLRKDVAWWENIQVHGRELNYFVFRKGSCLATLICEDLARTDPCQSSIRAVGPNLLIALLMDGPQLMHRWPSRYAMGLADDPGTSVLSVTSLGLIERSNKNFADSKLTIGLWRDLNETKELNLEPGEHGLVLKLKSRCVAEETLDGRQDGETAHVWERSEHFGIR